jgi:hypothetical protein
MPSHPHITTSMPSSRSTTRYLQVARALVDAMTAGAASSDTEHVVCVALASDSQEIVMLFQREFGDKLIHVDGPVVHIDRS